MSMLWKTLLGLAVILPVGGYVAGSLAAADPTDLQPRDTIVIRDAGDRGPAGNGGEHRRHGGEKDGDDRTETEGRTRPAEQADDDPDDDGHDVDTVEVEPDDVDDDSGPGSDDSGPDDDGDDDHSGHGSDGSDRDD